MRNFLCLAPVRAIHGLATACRLESYALLILRLALLAIFFSLVVCVDCAWRATSCLFTGLIVGFTIAMVLAIIVVGIRRITSLVVLLVIDGDADLCFFFLACVVHWEILA